MYRSSHARASHAGDDMPAPFRPGGLRLPMLLRLGAGGPPMPGMVAAAAAAAACTLMPEICAGDDENMPDTDCVTELKKGKFLGPCRLLLGQLL